MGVLRLSRADIPSSTAKDITTLVSSPAVMGSRSVSRCKKVYIRAHPEPVVEEVHPQLLDLIVRKLQS